MRPRLAALGLVVLALACAKGAPQARPYDEKLDGVKQLADAAGRVSGTNRRILAMVGGNW